MTDASAQALAEAAPAEALTAMETPIRQALASKQDADKPQTWAAAEAFAGLIASGALFASLQGKLEQHPPPPPLPQGSLSSQPFLSAMSICCLPKFLELLPSEQCLCLPTSITSL